MIFCTMVPLLCLERDSGICQPTSFPSEIIEFGLSYDNTRIIFLFSIVFIFYMQEVKLKPAILEFFQKYFIKFLKLYAIYFFAYIIHNF